MNKFNVGDRITCYQGSIIAVIESLAEGSYRLKFRDGSSGAHSIRSTDERFALLGRLQEVK